MANYRSTTISYSIESVTFHKKGKEIKTEWSFKETANLENLDKASSWGAHKISRKLRKKEKKKDSKEKLAYCTNSHPKIIRKF